MGPPPARYSLQPLPKKSRLVKQYRSASLATLPTPALVLDRAVIRRNSKRMREIARAWQLPLRVHVKTHKTAEATAAIVDGSGAVVISTLAEGWGLVKSDMVKKGRVRDILYGLPVAPNKIGELAALRKKVTEHSSKATVRILMDNIEQVIALDRFRIARAKAGKKTQPWSVMVKVENGGYRAGLPAGSEALASLIDCLLRSESTEIYGFYAHAGHSYSSRNANDAGLFLADEVKAVVQAAHMGREVLLRGDFASSKKSKDPTFPPWVLSVGSTPTAHAASQARSSLTLQRLRQELPPGVTLELHAGNYAFLDLQQLATRAQPGLDGHGTVPAKMEDVAISVLCSVVSTYPGRGAGKTQTAAQLGSESSLAQGGDEALIDGGGIAFSKDSGPWSGFGHVLYPSALRGWQLGRPSQEHGILTLRPQGWPEEWVVTGEAAATVGKPVQKETDAPPPYESDQGSEIRTSPASAAAPSTRRPVVGEMVRVVPQHACMTCAAHPWFYIVDSEKGSAGSDDEEEGDSDSDSSSSSSSSDDDDDDWWTSWIPGLGSEGESSTTTTTLQDQIQGAAASTALEYLTADNQKAGAGGAKPPAFASQAVKDRFAEKVVDVWVPWKGW